MKFNSFKDYLIEEDKVIYFTFGRMNPPTIGHEKLLDKLASSSGKNPYAVFLSQSQDPKKNPLSYADKVKHARRMFPKHARSIKFDKKVRTPFDALVNLYDQGYKSVVMVVGSDRVNEFKALTNKYNGQKGRHGFYNFNSIRIVSAGERDPDSEGVDGMSASKMRGYASDNNFTSFAQGLPSSLNNKFSRMLFNDVRKGMGLKEETLFKRHIELEAVCEEREQYVRGELFNLGDSVLIKETDELGIISSLGSNYVVIQLEDRAVRKWLTDVELVEGDKSKVKQDPDIKDREGSQPKSYHAGLSKSTKVARDRQFKKQTKMSDSNPAAYKPAPGDKTAKTKPSKYTKQFKQLYGEETQDNTAVDRVKSQIKREKERDKTKHDKMMDRARLKTARERNKSDENI